MLYKSTHCAVAVHCAGVLTLMSLEEDVSGQSPFINVTTAY